MTKSIIQLANEAHLYDDGQEPLVQHLEAFAAAIGAHIAELAGVEMPEPDMSNNGDCFGHEDVPCYSIQKMRETVASAVARKDAEIEECHEMRYQQNRSLYRQIDALTAELERVKQKTSMMLEQYELEEKEVNHWKAKCDALTAEVERLTTLQELTDANFRDVKTKRDALTAERERLKAALELALAHGSFEQGSGVIHDIREALKKK